LSIFTYRNYVLPSLPLQALGGYAVAEDLPSTCTEECDSKWVNITVMRTGFSISILKEKHEFQIPILEKNCDKLYWSDWVETTNCSSTKLSNYTRLCVNCDGKAVEEDLKPLCNGTERKVDTCHNSAIVLQTSTYLYTRISLISMVIWCNFTLLC